MGGPRMYLIDRTAPAYLGEICAFGDESGPGGSATQICSTRAFPLATLLRRGGHKPENAPPKTVRTTATISAKGRYQHHLFTRITGQSVRCQNARASCASPSNRLSSSLHTR